MSYTDQDRLTALAGVYQAAWCAEGIARRGMADSDSVETCINSIFQTDADEVAAVFGGLAHVASGLRQFVNQMEGYGKRDMDLTRYVIALLQLQHKLRANPAMLEQIGDSIDTARGRLEHYHLLHANILAQLAETYSNTISNLQPRIMVRGEPLHLQNPDNQNKIRALLLAGVRAAILWHQTGGRRRHILFSRKRLLETGRTMLNNIHA
jgi:high frequency lysogenization protein